MAHATPLQQIRFDRELIEKYDTTGPRYTSYPTAAEFRADFGPVEFRREIERAGRAAPARPLSLYFHIPFCSTVCYYCACNKVITANRARAQDYLARLYREIAMLAALVGPARRVVQLHWGGGTPTFLDAGQMRALMDTTRRHFHLADEGEGEYSIEIDPRRADHATLRLLRELGFNRLSMGIQDLDPAVQQAVNRVQSAEHTFDLLAQARRVGFRSVSVDLMYGLPRQTVAGFERTLRAVIAAAPDRLSVFNYAHLPHRFKTQRQIDEQELPRAAEKLAIFQRTVELLQDAGYVYIGMDHFARADDEMAVALADGTLQRNFQGYSTHAECELVAMGASAISQVGDCYAQNAHGLDDYYQRIDAGELATVRGVVLTPDDHIRRDVIARLICTFRLTFAEVESAHGIRFADYFTDELHDIGQMAADGLVDLDDTGVTVTGAGRLLIRNICMVFDSYRRKAPTRQQFSKVI